MLAITGVLFLCETRAKTLKMSPSLAIEKIMRGIPIASPSALQRRHSRVTITQQLQTSQFCAEQSLNVRSFWFCGCFLSRFAANATTQALTDKKLRMHNESWGASTCIHL